MPKFGDLPAEVLSLVGYNLDQRSIISLIVTAKYLGTLEPLLYQKVHLSSNKGAKTFYRAIRTRHVYRAYCVQSLRVTYRYSPLILLNRIIFLIKRLPNLQNLELVSSYVQGLKDPKFISDYKPYQRFIEALPKLETVSIDANPVYDSEKWQLGLLTLMEAPSLKVFKTRSCPQTGGLYKTCDVPLEFMEIANFPSDPSTTLFKCRPAKRLLLCTDFDKPNLESVVTNVVNSDTSAYLESLFIDIGPVAPWTDFNPYTYLSFKSFPRLKRLGLQWAGLCQAIFPVKESYEASRLDIFPPKLECLWLHFDDETEEDFDFAAVRFSTLFRELTGMRSTIAPRLKEVLYWVGRREGREEFPKRLPKLDIHTADVALREEPQTFVRSLTYKMERLQDFDVENYRAEPVDSLIY